ncbi:MAG TPA: excinuclease ABC subunit UvrC [Gallionellaceae bacterium]
MKHPEFDHKTFLATLPLLPGVYRMLDEKGQVLYVGKAGQLKKRVSSYFQKTNIAPRTRLMVSHIASIEVTVTRTEAEALLLENNLIKTLKPRYNILFRDDKSYPYIVLTGHAYPRLTYYRGATDRKSQYFGPYPNAYAAKESVQLLQKLFRLRTCEDTVFANRTRPCILYQIHRCTGPCCKLISQEDYAASIRNAALLLQGRHTELEGALYQAMHDASEAQHYEQAAVLRDQLSALHTVQQKQFVESARATDADIVVVAELEGRVCVNLAMVRGGRHLGDKSFFPQNGWQVAAGAKAEEEGDMTRAEVLEAFLAQHYLARSVPPLILTSEEIDVAALEEILAEQSGIKVAIRGGATGERKRWLEMAMQNAMMSLRRQADQESGQNRRMEALREALDLPDLARIECFDISHTMGEATVASCVVYDNLDIRTSEYRRYNITGVTPGDDYGAMRQALTRRYQKLEANLLSGQDGKRPDLILIDGGAGQLKVAMEVMAELGLNEIQLLGVAKGPARKPGEEELLMPHADAPMHLDPASPALHLIQQVRDEAHRFAIAGHRARRGKARTASALEEISGVGEKRRRNLLAHFGGMKGVQGASVEELAQVEGISAALAEQIYRQLH